jgi:endonuclease YncB( thermonuclease family)
MAATMMKSVVMLKLIALALVTALLSASPTLAETLRGNVVGVTDGDTVKLLVGGRVQYKVRLGEIDAPESGQPYGRASKQMLSSLVFGQTITARVTDVDRYGRSVAVLTRDGININAEMVKRGGAWAYRRYLSDQRYLLWERQARETNRGLWGLQADQIMAPWDWRAARRGGGRNPRPATPAAPTGVHAVSSSQTPVGTAQCGTKRLCRQMSSCEEAVYFLNSCRVGSLDGDGDGVPCEKICR